LVKYVDLLLRSIWTHSQIKPIENKKTALAAILAVIWKFSKR
jgi:hypothetical protein